VKHREGVTRQCNDELLRTCESNIRCKLGRTCSSFRLQLNRAHCVPLNHGQFMLLLAEYLLTTSRFILSLDHEPLFRHCDVCTTQLATMVDHLFTLGGCSDHRSWNRTRTLAS
jgi:hypothetical protein